MEKRIRYTPEFNQLMIEFLKAHPEATFDQGKAQAKSLDYETISKNKFNDLRREARGPAEAPKEVVMAYKTGRLIKLESAKTGDRVAIYSLKRLGRIQVSIVEE